MPVETVQNFVMHGGALGDSGDRLMQAGFDPGVLRPYAMPDGRSYVTRMIRNNRTGLYEPKVFLSNAPATLSYDSWKLFDQAILRVMRERLRFVADVRNRGLIYNLPNGMAHTMLQYQTQGDMTKATVSMDPIRRSEVDRPTTDIGLLPLPIVHKDLDFSLREIMASRQGNMPLDTNSAEIAARKVAEEIEDMAVGNVTAYSFGGGLIYGLITLPQRATKTDMTVPTGANGPTVLADILTLRQMLIDDRHYGPYMMYVNSQWSTVLDSDFSADKGDNTLRQRILALPDIMGIQTLDHLPATQWHVVLVEMSSQTVRMVVGMEVQTVQWESLGGMMKHFKVMAMIIPQIRGDQGGNSGVAHGRTA